MIAILTNAGDATSDFFEAQIRRKSLKYVRINTEWLPAVGLTYHLCNDSAEATIRIDSLTLDIRKISSVYYRRPRVPVLHDIPGQPGTARWMASELRKAWGGLLASANWLKWVNHPLAISGATYKPEQLSRASAYGLSIPESLITSDPGVAHEFCTRHNWDVIAKPIGHGLVYGDAEGDDWLIYTNRLDKDHAHLLHRISSCPTLFQQRIDKRLDLRITVVEDVCISVALHSQERDHSMIDCRRENMRGMRYTSYELPDRIARQLVSLTHSYGLYYSAIDIGLTDDGVHWFFEINPAGQWAWLEQIAGAPISDQLIKCLTQPARSAVSPAPC